MMRFLIEQLDNLDSYIVEIDKTGLWSVTRPKQHRLYRLYTSVQSK